MSCFSFSEWFGLEAAFCESRQSVVVLAGRICFSFEVVKGFENCSKVSSFKYRKVRG